MNVEYFETRIEVANPHLLHNDQLVKFLHDHYHITDGFQIQRYSSFEKVCRMLDDMCIKLSAFLNEEITLTTSKGNPQTDIIYFKFRLTKFADMEMSLNLFAKTEYKHFIIL